MADNGRSEVTYSDLVIVGGGAAGICAALEADRRGFKCIILEADQKLGGSTYLSSGVYCAAGSDVQKRAGLQDSPDALYEYIMTLNQWLHRPDIVRTLCDNAVDGMNFLISCGVEFHDDCLCGGGRTRVARGHYADGYGKGIVARLEERLNETRTVVKLGTRAKSLIVEDGKVVGVKAADDREYRSSAVLITTGGFSNNPAMVERLFPSVAQHGGRFTTQTENAPYLLGDGVAMGERIGARIVGHDWGLPLPTSGFKEDVVGFVPNWVMLVNAEGRRFMAETAPYSVSGYIINRQPGAQSWAIFDDATLRSMSDGYFKDHPELRRLVVQGVPGWNYESVNERVAAGLIGKAETIQDLAAEAGIDPAMLDLTLERYNSDMENRADGQFFKADGFFPIREAPFYAVKVTASLIGLTGTGLNINTRAQVLDNNDQVIPGLYAAGEVLGCVIGPRFAMGGMAITNAVVFGRIAGKSAVHDVIQHEKISA